MFYDLLATAIETAGRNQLDDLFPPGLEGPWRGHRCRRSGATAARADPAAGEGPSRLLVPLSALPTIAPRYFIQRSPEQRSPDRRASLLRRREHAATGPLPPHLAAGFTTGELAVLKVISDEWLAHGACDRSLNELAARAGVCHSLAKRAVRLAELDGLYHGTASAAVRPQAPHQHHPHHPRRMARLAGQGPAQDLCGQRLQQGQADLCGS